MRGAIAAVMVGAIFATPSLAAALSYPPIPLPTPDAPTAPLSAQLGQLEAGEAQQVAPGPITDDEAVVVGLSPDGRVADVHVDQRLSLTGTGDFRLRIAGPARDVAPLPGTTVVPGLQRGSVVWLGFSGGHRDMGARVTLDPQQEQFRLPLAVTIASGELRLHNQTAQPVQLVDAEPDPVALRSVRTAITAALARNVRPLAGVGSIPATLPARSASVPVSATVAAPLFITGRATTTVGPVALGQIVTEDDTTVALPGRLTDMEFTVSTVLPDLRSPASSTPREALADVERFLAKTAQSAGLDTYLGNPNAGSSHTTFHYATAKPARPRVVPREHRQTMTLALAALAGLMVIATGVLWWRIN